MKIHIDHSTVDGQFSLTAVGEVLVGVDRDGRDLKIAVSQVLVGVAAGH